MAHVGRPAEAEAAVAATLERFGALDVLVNNAGTNPYFGPLLGIDDVRLQKTFEINQASIVTWSRAAWNQWMSTHGGAILNVASIGGLGAEPGIGWYNATKAAVIHLTRQLAFELAPTVRVNGIAPGLVRTELARGLWEGNEERIAKSLPLGRIGEVDDVAPIALLLVSDAASWITGQTIVVDGGTTTRSSGGVELRRRASGAAPCPTRCGGARSTTTSSFGAAHGGSSAATWARSAAERRGRRRGGRPRRRRAGPTRRRRAATPRPPRRPSASRARARRRRARPSRRRC